MRDTTRESSKCVTWSFLFFFKTLILMLMEVLVIIIIEIMNILKPLSFWLIAQLKASKTKKPVILENVT